MIINNTHKWGQRAPELQWIKILQKGQNNIGKFLPNKYRLTKKSINSKWVGQ
jgi:hypothetical protein